MFMMSDTIARYLSKHHQKELEREAQKERLRHPRPITFFVKTGASRRASFRDPARKLGSDLN